MVIAHGQSLFPPHLVGRGITLLNIGTMGGGFVVQFVSGSIIDLFPQRRPGPIRWTHTGWCLRFQAALIAGQRLFLFLAVARAT